MKKYLSIFAFATIALVCLSSCGSDDNDIPVPPTPTSTTTGVAKRTGNIEVKWVQLWKDGPKFAEYNVGAANNKAEDYGGYYCWGSSIDKDECAAYKSGDEALTGNDDTATNLWGSNWRMPTEAELEALLYNCTSKQAAVNGVYGRKYTGKGDYASNSVFLPYAGGFFDFGVDFGQYVYGQGKYGNYWSSTPDGSSVACILTFDLVTWYVGSTLRNDGSSVRAVLAED